MSVFALFIHKLCEKKHSSIIKYLSTTNNAGVQAAPEVSYESNKKRHSHACSSIAFFLPDSVWCVTDLRAYRVYILSK